MPGFDGTGPAGLGPKTGRAAGSCAGYGRRWGGPISAGRPFGRGFGFRHGSHPSDIPGRRDYVGDIRPDRETEMEYLKHETESAERYLEVVRARLAALAVLEDSPESES